jgi:hypothetical protein
MKNRKNKATTEQPERSTNVQHDHMGGVVASGADVYDSVVTQGYALYHGDCVEVMRRLPDRSVDFSIFSPPFEGLFVYSNSPRDMGNCRNSAQFGQHFGYLVEQYARVMKRGRIVAFHCMDLPTSKEKDGYIGLRDFPGDLIRFFQSHGFIFHSKSTIWKDPVTAMQRTKAYGLLHKTTRENSSFARMGIPDYVIAMRAPGEIEHGDRVTHSPDEFPVSAWQQVASPIWSDIDQSDTLQRESARAEEDERHLCPLQLEVIRRCIDLWTNPGDIVLSPFAGIGSEGHIAVGGATTQGVRLSKARRFVGIELKDSYYAQAVKNLKAASTVRQLSLMDRMMGAE